MYDTGKGGFEVAGPCPASHPVRVPQLAYETLWNTTAFNDKSLWPTDGSQPFVWSTGDTIGYTTHGDYVFGWKGDALQKAMNSSCFFDDCGNGNPLLSQNASEANKCIVKPTVIEPLGDNECESLQTFLKTFILTVRLAGLTALPGREVPMFLV